MAAWTVQSLTSVVQVEEPCGRMYNTSPPTVVAVKV